MLRKASLRFLTGASLLLLLTAAPLFAQALPHGDDDSNDNNHGGMQMDDMTMGHGMESHSSHGVAQTPSPSPASGPMSYFAFEKYTGSILAHIVLEVLAWFFILPLGMSCVFFFFNVLNLN